MEIKVVNENEVHIITYNFISERYITFNGGRFELVHMESDRLTRKRTYMFVQNYF